MYLCGNCFGGTTRNPGELPVSSVGLEEFCCFFPFVSLTFLTGRARPGQARRVRLSPALPTVCADRAPGAPPEPTPARLCRLFISDDVWLRFHFRPSGTVRALWSKTLLCTERSHFFLYRGGACASSARFVSDTIKSLLWKEKASGSRVCSPPRRRVFQFTGMTSRCDSRLGGWPRSPTSPLQVCRKPRCDTSPATCPRSAGSRLPAATCQWSLKRCLTVQTTGARLLLSGAGFLGLVLHGGFLRVTCSGSPPHTPSPGVQCRVPRCTTCYSCQ